ncbi:uncharacterized protein LOC134281627 [Saccostrea cucullata]|uniref:uncharacterized protein LOC134281627 n=1 Tax=Saccostrea cuccullata TaxID=36930 RepID=UPI002ED0A565
MVMNIHQSAGSFLKEILQSKKAHVNGHINLPFEENAIDLVVGETGFDDLQILNIGGRSPGSVSDDMDLVSDPGDPIHSETPLKELFYKNPDSEVSKFSELSDEEIKHRNTASKMRTVSPAPSMEDPDILHLIDNIYNHIFEHM